MLDVMNFIFADPWHYVGVCLLLLIILPWNWTRRREEKHIYEVRLGRKKPAEKKREQPENRVHVDAP